MSRKLTEEIVALAPELQEEMWKLNKGANIEFIRVGQGKCLMPKSYTTVAEKYFNFEVRPDDVWICGIPRSGTTLTEQMVWFILTDVDQEKAKNVHTLRRTPYFESDLECSEEFAARICSSPDLSEAVKENVRLRVDTSRFLESTKERRVMKTHLHFAVLPPEIFTRGCKIIYVARNPKDVIVSYYHLQKVYPERSFTGSLKQFVDLYKRDLVIWTPYWTHIKQAWSKREHPDFKFVFYEDLMRDLKKGIREMAEFLDKPLEDAQIEELADFLGFRKFRKFMYEEDQCWTDVDFVRKGRAGGWRDYFDAEMTEDVDKWIEENSRSIGIQFTES